VLNITFAKSRDKNSCGSGGEVKMNGTTATVKIPAKSVVMIELQ